MKNHEVIDKILEYHPVIPDYTGCDGYKAGDPQEECIGIATALVPTVEVIRSAIRKNCNLIITHEPIFYQTPDFADWRGDFANKTYEEKKKLLTENHITVWRDHDHIHAHQPDGIFTGVIRQLGWEKYMRQEKNGPGYLFDIPEMAVKELGDHLISRMHLHGLRYIGAAEDKIEKVAIVGHIYPDSFYRDHTETDGTYHDYGMDVIRMMEEGVQAIIPGEIIEWTTLSYIRDSIAFGQIRACYNVGHFNMEEAGMKYAAEWIGELVDNQIPVQYIPTEDGFRYMPR